jgi:hypothetical protein
MRAQAEKIGGRLAVGSLPVHCTSMDAVVAATE